MRLTLKCRCPHCARPLKARVDGDFVRSEKCYRCGQIAPGFALRTRAVRVEVRL